MGRESRKYSVSEPLLPEAVDLIQKELQRHGVDERAHVFVVFGASVRLVCFFASAMLCFVGRFIQEEDFSYTLVALPRQIASDAYLHHRLCAFGLDAGQAAREFREELQSARWRKVQV